MGGGPAGATAAALLALQGIPVVVLDERSPTTPPLGQSLLPHALPILDRIGVHEAVRTLPHTREYRGFTFVAEDERRVTYRFDQALAPALPFAYQVRRDEFDGAVLNRARELGAEVRSGWQACAPIWDGRRLTGMTVRDPEGEQHHLFARAILDATGQAAFLASRMGWRFPYSRRRRTSLITQFPIDEKQDDNAGDRVIVHRGDGWIWFVPLSGGICLAAATVDEAHGGSLSENPEGIFHALVENTPYARNRFSRAEGMPAVQVSRVQSFRVMRMAGDGFALLGDAAGFLDPLCATGIYQALASGASAAEDVADALARHGRVDGSDFGPTISLTRSMFRAFFAWNRALEDPRFLAFLFAPPRRASLSAGLASLLAGDVVERGSWRARARFLALRLLVFAHIRTGRPGNPRSQTSALPRDEM